MFEVVDNPVIVSCQKISVSVGESRYLNHEVLHIKAASVKYV